MPASAQLLTAYPGIAALHAVIGTLALAAFWTAAAARKGGRLHRFAGRTYLLAMVGIVLSGALLALGKWWQGHPISAAFLGYLLVITVHVVWVGWRAVRDRGDVVRYTGPVFVGLGLASLLAGAAIGWLGLRVGSPLLIGFSLVGLLSGADALRKRQTRARLVADRMWWRREHYTAMLGNAVATHIAFLSIGLPRLLPGIDGSALFYAAWFGPLLLAGIAKLGLDRRYPVIPALAARSRPAVAAAPARARTVPAAALLAMLLPVAARGAELVVDIADVSSQRGRLTVFVYDSADTWDAGKPAAPLLRVYPDGGDRLQAPVSDSSPAVTRIPSRAMRVCRIRAELCQ